MFFKYLLCAKHDAREGKGVPGMQVRQKLTYQSHCHQELVVGEMPVKK